MPSLHDAARIGPCKSLAVALMSAALAACTQVPFTAKSVTANSGLAGATHEASQPTKVQSVNHAATERHVQPGGAAVGLASFYDEGSETASGEKPDPRELTAAHPTLPFGTRLRVTNLANGRSVIVRVNDRGPFVVGRVVDVSRSAAETLEMEGRGVAKVRIEVVQ